MAVEPDRPRRWGVHFVAGRGGLVFLRHYPILADGEELTEETPHKTISWQEWEQTHTDYGLTVDGGQMEV